MKETSESFREYVEIPVIKGPKLHGGVELAIGQITANTLVSRYVIPRRDHTRKTGYQREASITRVNKLVKDSMAERTDLPTAILINIREFEEIKNLVEKNHQLQLPWSTHMTETDDKAIEEVSTEDSEKTSVRDTAQPDTGENVDENQTSGLPTLFFFVGFRRCLRGVAGCSGRRITCSPVTAL